MRIQFPAQREPIQSEPESELHWVVPQPVQRRTGYEAHTMRKERVVNLDNTCALEDMAETMDQ